MNAKELAGSISRFVGQIKPTNNPSDDAVIKGFPEWFIEDLENSATMLRQQADRIAELEKAKTLTPELDSLLCSVNGDAYLGKTIEQKLVAVVRKQYSRPKNITEEEVRDIYRKLFGSEMSYQTAIFSKILIRMARQNEL